MSLHFRKKKKTWLLISTLVQDPGLFLCLSAAGLFCDPSADAAFLDVSEDALQAGPLCSCRCVFIGGGGHGGGRHCGRKRAGFL